MNIKIVLDYFLDECTYMPVRAHENDAGFDLFSPKDYIIHAFGSIIINTGVRMAIPEGYYGKIESRSGLNFKRDIMCTGGVIDSGYTGPISVKLFNYGDTNYQIYKGDRIAQLIILPYLKDVIFTPVMFLDETDRGDNGFGSTDNERGTK